MNVNIGLKTDFYGVDKELFDKCKHMCYYICHSKGESIMKVFAVISDVKINNEDNYKYYSEIIVDIWDYQGKSIKRIVPNFNKDDVYDIGEIICYDINTNCIQTDYTDLYDYQVFTLFFMRNKYTELLKNYLQEEIDFIKDAKIDGNYEQVNKYKHLKEFKSYNEKRCDKLRTIINSLDNLIDGLMHQLGGINHNPKIKK